MDNAATVVLLQTEIDDFDYCAKLLSDDFKIVISTTNYEEALAEIKIYKPAFFISPLYIPYADGLFVVGQAKKYSPDTVCIILDHARSKSLVELALRSGADYFAYKPANYSDLCKIMKIRYSGFDSTEVRGIDSANSLENTCSTPDENGNSSDEQAETLCDFATAQAEQDGNYAKTQKGEQTASGDNPDFQENKLEEALSKILIEMGIPPHLKGFYYLRMGVVTAIKNPNYICSVTKKLYPQIAETYHASVSMVERAIRHAIDIAWNKGKTDVINNLLGVKAFTNEYKPTNSEFIALVADRLTCAISKKGE